MKKYFLFSVALLAFNSFSYGQWINQYTTPGLVSLYDLHCLDANNCYADGWGPGGIIIKTTDGTNWLVSYSGSTQFAGIFCTDVNICYAGSDDGNIYKTTNGGSTWIPKDAAGTHPYIFFVSDSIGYAFSGGGDMAKTVDAGETWNLFGTPITNFLGEYGIFFINTSTGYRCGGGVLPNKALIYKTTNGGNTWTKVFEDTTLNGLASIQFINDSVGYTVGSKGMIFKTTDAGQNWVAMNNPYQGDINTTYKSVYFTDEQRGYVIGNIERILKTNDGGSNWTEDTLNTPCGLLRKVYISNNEGYIIGCSQVYKNDSTGLSTSIKNISTNKTIGKIFPNPFSTSATFFINESRNATCDFVLYDLLGREVKRTTINQTRTKIDRDNLPSGMYFYKISDGEKIIGTGKIIIQ